jgi:hypothetical protein
VIAGRVVDSDGNPLRNFWVDALRPSYENGVRTFSPLKSAQTDDRGEYRLFDLIPGRYFVAVSPPSRPRIENDVYFVPAAPMMRPNSRHQFERNTPGAAAISQGIVEASAFSNDLYLPTFYPGTLVASAAAPVVLSEGMSMRLDLSTARQHTVRIRGKVLNGATNTPVEKPKVYLTPDDGFDSSLIESRWNGAEGTFEFEGVAAGVYELYGYGSGLRVRMPLNVGERDIDNLVVALKPGITVKARVSIEGAADNSVPLGGIGGALRPGFLFNASPDGQFTLDDLAEGPYRLSLTLPEQLAGYYIKSARLGSIEVLNGPLDINSAVDGAIQVVLARNGATLDATVLDAEQVPLAGASVVVVPQPALRQRWDLYRAAVTGSSGRVHIEGIAPGDYSVFSWESIGRNAWQDPNVIRAVEGQATPVRFDEGGARNLTLKAIPVSR